MDARDVHDIASFSQWTDENLPNDPILKSKLIIATISFVERTLARIAKGEVSAETQRFTSLLDIISEQREIIGNQHEKIASGELITSMVTDMVKEDNKGRHTVTGLIDQYRFDAEVAKNLMRERRRNQWIVISIGDGRGFKRINDEISYATGDRVLRAIADAFLAHIRYGEIVASRGGDEFFFMLTSSSPKLCLEGVHSCNKVVENLQLAFLPPNYPLKMDSAAIFVKITGHAKATGNPNDQSRENVTYIVQEMRELVETAIKPLKESIDAKVKRGSPQYLEIPGQVTYSLFEFNGLILKPIEDKPSI